jgi:hypothetical protein
MTKEQIEQLRALIQCEIDYAMQEESGYRFSYETKEFNDGAWETFIDSFTRLRMTTTGGDSFGDV